jgi:hypothetical protein
VTHYGVTLDQEASPEQVAYVLLRSIREDVRATNETERESALDKQFDLCAADEIQRKNNTSLSRDELVHNIVWRWTPTVSHYVGGFELEQDKAVARFERRTLDSSLNAAANAGECEILMEVTGPEGDPNARVVMVIYFAKDNGYWRVTHLGFEPASRSINGNSNDNG